MLAEWTFVDLCSNTDTIDKVSTLEATCLDENRQVLQSEMRI